MRERNQMMEEQLARQGANAGIMGGMLKQWNAALPQQAAPEAAAVAPPPSPNATIDQAMVAADEAFEGSIASDIVKSARGNVEKVKVIQNEKDSGFMDWWRSPGGSVARSGFFDAMTQIGAGLAGIPAGSGDMSSVAKGIQNAGGSYERAVTRYHTGQFRSQINQRIQTEKAKDKPDQALLSKLYAAAADPGAYIKGEMSRTGLSAMDKHTFAVALKQADTAAQVRLDAQALEYWDSLDERQRDELRDPDTRAATVLLHGMAVGSTMPLLIGSLERRKYLKPLPPTQSKKATDAYAEGADRAELAGDDVGAQAFSELSIKTKGTHPQKQWASDEAARLAEKLGIVTDVDE
jgi:hypothetical protein